MELDLLPSPSPDAGRLPSWLKRPLPSGDAAHATRRIVRESGIATVCEQARCPNLGECWEKRHATFMILGDICTRRCAFCAVETGKPATPTADEPRRLADAAARLDLRHAVLTAVARDDLPDEGAGHFSACVRAIRSKVPSCAIEVLPADFHAREDCIRTLCGAEPDIYNHNQETVERLSPDIRPAARYGRSLDVLRKVKAITPSIFTKSGLMVGLGETRAELSRTLADLRGVGVDVLTVGQYLRPSREHRPVSRYVPPAEFDEIAEEARSLGFRAVASGPFVRSSYNAADVYQAIEQKRGQ